MPAAERDQIGSILGRIPSGIFILTVRTAAGDETGMLASWVQQASFEPPALSIAVKQERYVNDWLTNGAAVAVNALGEGHKKLLAHFGKGFEPGQNAFEGLGTATAPNGVTVLADCLGWLSGSVGSHADAGDHRVHIVNITAAGQGSQPAAPPLVHLRKNGFNY